MTKIDREERTKKLRAWTRAQGGVAHSIEARAAGYSAHDLALAVAGGDLVRIRRSWVATTDCDPTRLRAASISGRVTCVSAAKLEKLWIPRLDEKQQHPHIAVRPTSSRFDASGLNVHWAKGPVIVSRTVVTDPIVNVLFHIARCLPRLDALAVWESAIRKGLADPVVLAKVEWGSSLAKELAEMSSALSDSGLETIFIARLRDLPLQIRQQVRIDGHPVDALIGERLVTQLDGFEHHRAKDRRRDLRADARLALRGYTVLRFDYQQVFYDWPFVESTILTAVAQGLHRARR
ncbi:DUF559 domain-containing protein [Microbacterium pumilum]|uniref:DUF559 domain-containing protein n=1 Tax=Microbacterium pumilum TaxID=344165 RepID=A0ABP5E4N6_9MICO